MKHFTFFTLLFFLICFSGRGQSWIKLETGVAGARFNHLDFVSNQLGYVAGDNGLILKTTNGGIRWEVLNTGTTENFAQIDALTADIVYAAGTNGTLIKSLDGGETWNSVAPDVNADLVSVQFINTEIGYVASDNGVIYATQNGAEWWWEYVASSIPGNAIEIRFINDSLGHFLFSSGFVYDYQLYSDVGSRMRLRKRGDGNMNDVQSMFFLDFTTGFVAQNGKFLSSSGRNWSSGTPQAIASTEVAAMHFLDRQEGFAAPTNQLGVIYHTTDGGQTWDEQALPGIGGLGDMKFPSSQIGYACSYNGEVFKYIKSAEGECPFAIRSYPNPTFGQLTVEALGDYEVHLFSSEGQVVFSRAYANQTLEIDVSNLTAGFYYLKINTDECNFTEKIVVN